MNDSTRLRGIRAIVFDVFGTLAEIRDKRRPYTRLLQVLHKVGRSPRRDDAALLMSNNVGFANLPKFLGLELSCDSIAMLELDLHTELQSIKLYDDVVSTLTTLRESGYKLGLCSNLATPYAAPIKSLLPFELDAYAWSFEAGTVKPEPAIYEMICASLDCTPSQVVMIGDSIKADYIGPRRIGMHGIHLARNGKSPVTNSMKTLDEILSLVESEASK